MASRAALSDNYDDPYNFTYANHVGVCWDFTNILTIMCRQHGIPCTSLDNKAHTINAVYMNSEWVAIDVTTELFNAGVDPEQIRRIMGHTNIAMTEHYNRTDGKINVDPEIWKKIFDKPEN